jgi:hypothetical protein
VRATCVDVFNIPTTAAIEQRARGVIVPTSEIEPLLRQRTCDRTELYEAIVRMGEVSMWHLDASVAVACEFLHQYRHATLPGSAQRTMLFNLSSYLSTALFTDSGYISAPSEAALAPPPERPRRPRRRSGMKTRRGGGGYMYGPFCGDDCGTPEHTLRGLLQYHRNSSCAVTGGLSSTTDVEYEALQSVFVGTGDAVPTALCVAHEDDSFFGISATLLWRRHSKMERDDGSMIEVEWYICLLETSNEF